MQKGDIAQCEVRELSVWLPPDAYFGSEGFEVLDCFAHQKQRYLTPKSVYAEIYCSAPFSKELAALEEIRSGLEECRTVLLRVLYEPSGLLLAGLYPRRFEIELENPADPSKGWAEILLCSSIL